MKKLFAFVLLFGGIAFPAIGQDAATVAPDAGTAVSSVTAPLMKLAPPGPGAYEMHRLDADKGRSADLVIKGADGGKVSGTAQFYRALRACSAFTSFEGSPVGSEFKIITTDSVQGCQRDIILRTKVSETEWTGDFKGLKDTYPIKVILKR